MIRPGPDIYAPINRLPDLGPATSGAGVSVTSLPVATALNSESKLQTLEISLDRLDAGKRRLAKLTVGERISLLEQCLLSVGNVAQEWTEAACLAKGIPSKSPARAEEILAGPVATLRQLQLFLTTMRHIHRRGAPPVPKLVDHPSGKRLGARVTPTAGLFDPLCFVNFTATTWLNESITRDNIRQHLAPAYEGLGRTGLSVVLGAGNVSSISLTDALTKLCVDNRAVLIKMNPVNEYLAPIFERAFSPLIENDLLRIMTGDAEIAAKAMHDPRVDDVHITGSGRTHDAICWGADPETQQRRKQANDSLLKKPITSELGNVSPWIVVPGAYSRGQLWSQAQNIVGSLTNNAAFNCVATRAIITWKQWPERERFLELIEGTLAQVPQRKAYYPGAQQRYATFTGVAPDDAQKHLKSGTLKDRGLSASRVRADGTTFFVAGPQRRDDSLPWTLIRNMSPSDASPLLCDESFVCVCVEVAIDATSPEDFLNKAVEFSNEKLWGTLAGSMSVPNSFRRSQNIKLQDAIDRLRYGVVSLNQWSGLAFALMSPPWGGYPGGSKMNPLSGVGWVHNSLMLTGIEKTVVSAPLVVEPKPVWVPAHYRPEPVAWALVELFRNPSWVNASKLAMTATVAAMARQPN